MIRIVLAGVIGGIAMFIGGAFSHMFLELESRSFRRLPDEAAMLEFVSGQKMAPGMYAFPEVAENYAKMSAPEQGLEYERINAAFRNGPAGHLIVAPTGEDMMGWKQLGGELIANVLAALLAAFIVAHLSSLTSFARRWLIIVLLGPISWLSLTLSFALWYRFPMTFIQDGLFASLIEWTLAGAVVAAIVRPIMRSR
jgi:hypothetical protein